jgi:hypothetical protein
MEFTVHKALFVAVALLFPIQAHAQGNELGSNDYILGMFPFKDAAHVKLLQPISGIGSPKLAGCGLACPGSNLMPATPGQSAKWYHIVASVLYDNPKVPGGLT